MSAGVRHMQMTTLSLYSSPFSILRTPIHSPAVEIVRGEPAFIRRLGHAVVDAAVVVAGRHRHALAQTGRSFGRPNGGSRRRLLRPRDEVWLIWSTRVRGVDGEGKGGCTYFMCVVILCLGA